MTTSDMPLDSSFAPQIETIKEKKISSKPKINAVGKSTGSKTKTTSISRTNASSKSQKLRTKLSKSDVELADLEKLNEENIKQYRFKSKRNKVVIVLLSVLLAIAITTIVVYMTIVKLENNCNLYAYGVDATFFVDDEELTKFRAPTNLQGDSRFIFELKVKINQGGRYNIKFIPNVYQKGVLISNTLIYGLNHELFREGGDGYYYSKAPIEGNQTILLCNGIILDKYYKRTLNVDNFKLDFNVYFEEA